MSWKPVPIEEVEMTPTQICVEDPDYDGDQNATPGPPTASCTRMQACRAVTVALLLACVVGVWSATTHMEALKQEQVRQSEQAELQSELGLELEERQSTKLAALEEHQQAHDKTTQQLAAALASMESQLADLTRLFAPLLSNQTSTPEAGVAAEAAKAMAGAASAMAGAAAEHARAEDAQAEAAERLQAADALEHKAQADIAEAARASDEAKAAQAASELALANAQTVSDPEDAVPPPAGYR